MHEAFYLYTLQPAILPSAAVLDDWCLIATSRNGYIEIFGIHLPSLSHLPNMQAPELPSSPKQRIPVTYVPDNVSPGFIVDDSVQIRKGAKRHEYILT